MRIPYRPVLLLSVALAGCTKTDPLYCDQATPCDDSERPFCDLEGEYAESEGIKRTCIADPDFSITLADDDAQVRISGELPLDVTVDRKASFPADITLSVDGLPSGATAEPVVIPANSSTGTILVQAADSDPGALADARVIAASGPLERTADLRLLVLGPAGTLDPTFGRLGLAAEPSSTTDDASGLFQMADGSLIVGGATFVTDVGALVGWSAEGALDTAFGVDGVREFAMSDVGLAARLPYAFAQQSDGMIVMAVGSADGDLGLARFTSGGELDATFAGGGIVVSTISTDPVGIGAVATGRDDEILVGMTLGSGDRLLLVRYTRDGVRDPSFADDGVIIDRGTSHSIGDLRVLSGGSVLVAGKATDPSSTRVPFVTRYTPQGALDEAFGEGGAHEFDPEVTVRRVLELAGGDFLVAGAITDAEATPPNTPVVWRLTSAGEIDARFAAAGVLEIAGVDGSVNDLLETESGAIGIASPDITLVRFDEANGHLDPAFGNEGVSGLPLAEGFATKVVRRTDGRIVVLADDDSIPFVLARFFE